MRRNTSEGRITRIRLLRIGYQVGEREHAGDGCLDPKMSYDGLMEQRTKIPGGGDGLRSSAESRSR